MDDFIGDQLSPGAEALAPQFPKRFEAWCVVNPDGRVVYTTTDPKGAERIRDHFKTVGNGTRVIHVQELIGETNGNVTVFPACEETDPHKRIWMPGG